jgi:hypothetical protein
MMETNANPNSTPPDASQQVAEARSILLRMKEKLAHPELDVAIEKLEMALSILTTKTGGML